MSKTFLIYDADSLAYRSAAAIETRQVKITSKRNGKSAIYKTKTEHKKLVLAAGKTYDPEQLIIEELRESQPAVFGCNIVDKQIKEINDRLFADDYLVCIEGKDNFRSTLPLPSKYKGSRDGLARPEHLRAVKKHLVRNHPSLLVNNYESDDALIIKGYEKMQEGYTVILVSQDKDAKSYSGLNLYDFTQDNPEIILVPEFGELTLEIKPNGTKKVKGIGFIWFCMQAILGDRTDSYCPYELASKLYGVKYGEMSAYNALKDCTTEQEALQVVVDTYKGWYKEPFVYQDWQGNAVKSDWKHMLCLFFKCARMMSHENDKLDAVEFFESKGVPL